MRASAWLARLALPTRLRAARFRAVSGRGKDADTSIGGPRQAFPLTPRSAVLGAGSDDPVARARAFTRLVRGYWKPVYKHVRLRWRKSNEEAKDLTQAFFARAFENGTFAAYDASIAKFRTFVKRCLDNYVANAEEARTAQKRGGGMPELSLDFGEAEDELALAGAVAEETLEDVFDREWIASTVGACAAELKTELEGRGRGRAYEVFARYDLEEGDGERPTYAALAKELGIKPSDVSNYLNATRARFREIVLERLSELTATEAELAGEAESVLGASVAR
jgi:RNA polymerase sigma factor (sigma-70 family)